VTSTSTGPTTVTSGGGGGSSGLSGGAIAGIIIGAAVAALLCCLLLVCCLRREVPEKDANDGKGAGRYQGQLELSTTAPSQVEMVGRETSNESHV
jgi:hypothetical protein